MSRLTIEVTTEQHQQIKVLAAMQGQTIKDYIVNKLFKQNDEQAEQAAWEQLKNLLNTRLSNAQERGVSTRTVQEITESAISSLDNAR